MMLSSILAAALFAVTPVSFAALPLTGVDLLSDRKIALTANEPRPTVVVFMSSRCPCSSSHEPLIQALAKEHTWINFVGVHANVNEPADEAKLHFQGANFEIPVIEDSKGEWAEHFKALKTPHAFIVDASGRVLFSGGVTDSSHAPSATKHFLKEALHEYRESGNIKQNHQRALGCAIKRRQRR